MGSFGLLYCNFFGEGMSVLVLGHASGLPGFSSFFFLVMLVLLTRSLRVVH